MDNYAKLRARILKHYWWDEWRWHGSGKSLTVVNVKTGETRYFKRIERK